MSKVPKGKVLDELSEGNIWTEYDEWLDDYWESYWDDISSGDLSWQWYMEVSIRYREDWRYVIINKDYKNVAVETWIKENYPTCTFKYERNHFLIKEHEHPILLKQYLRKEISLETICILLTITGAIKYWNKKMEYDPIWDDVKLKIEKYIPFIQFDKEKFKKIVVDKYDDIG